MKKATQAQLSFMMFLEFFIWGGWFVTLGSFLGNNLSATGGETALAYSTQSWGAIIAPFIIGLIAIDDLPDDNGDGPTGGGGGGGGDEIIAEDGNDFPVDQF